MTPTVAGCRGVPSHMTLRDAWEAVQADRSPVARVPFRCSVCRWWHTESRAAVKEAQAA